MKKASLCFLLSISIVSIFSPKAQAAGQDVAEETGRYQVFEVMIEDKAAPLLLDTKTGKAWLYQSEGTSGRKNFVGIGVEGLVYQKRDAEEISNKIHQWNSDGLLDENVKGFSSKMSSEFSYFIDSEKARKINDEMKGRSKNNP